MTVIGECLLLWLAVADTVDVLGGYGSQSSDADENSNDADYAVQTSQLLISQLT